MARSAIVDMPGFRRRAALPEAMEASAPKAVMAAVATRGHVAAAMRCSAVPPASRGPMALETAAREAAVHTPPSSWAHTSQVNAVRFTAQASFAVCVRAAGTRRAIWASDSRSIVSLCRPQVNLNSGGAGSAVSFGFPAFCCVILRLLQLGCEGTRFTGAGHGGAARRPRPGEAPLRCPGNWRE
ncbi:hypothetical protein [Streptomyces sp. A1547]|uniref:hypothetical protein n=1 Tax=Streptomyces sp. A1547 TaxID=2563105 RepID=UPI001F10873F|nr:hypothetical protein [Streptomyces sp. A1547]